MALIPEAGPQGVVNGQTAPTNPAPPPPSAGSLTHPRIDLALCVVIPVSHSRPHLFGEGEGGLWYPTEVGFMDKKGEGVACLVRSRRPERVPGGSERRGRGRGLRSCLGQSLGPGLCGWRCRRGWESRSHDSWSEGRRVWWPCLWEPQVLGEVGEAKPQDPCLRETQPQSEGGGHCGCFWNHLLSEVQVERMVQLSGVSSILGKTSWKRWSLRTEKGLDSRRGLQGACFVVGSKAW